MAEPTPDTTRRALLKSADVCDLAKVQPYVLRSWEKEFPDLGVAKAAGGPRFYRQADVDRVLRIKHLVFAEGLTLAGARRKLEEERAAQAEDDLPFEDVVVTRAPAATPETRARIEGVKQGLRALLDLLRSERRGASGPERPADAVASDEPLLPMDEAVAVARPGKKKARAPRQKADAPSPDSQG